LVICRSRNGRPALDHPRLVAQDALEDAEAPARGDHPRRHDPSHDGHVRTRGRRARLGDRRHGGGVEVAERDVVEEVAHRGDAETAEQLGAVLADALEELDG